MKKLLTLFAFASALAVSCSKKDDSYCPAEDLEFTMRVSAEVRDLVCDTRTALYNSESDITGKTLYIRGWEDEKDILTAEASYGSGKWNLTNTCKLRSTRSYVFWASTDNSHTSFYKDSVTLDVADITRVQEDILLGGCAKDKPENGDVNLTLMHPFASLIFRLSAVDSVKSVNEISLSGIYTSGKAKLGADGNCTWSNLKSGAVELKETGLNVQQDDIATFQDSIATFVVIPQNLASNNVTLSMKYTHLDGTTGKSLVKVLSSGEWKAGYTTTYNIGHVDEVDGQVTDNGAINNGKSAIYVRAMVVGAWYDGSDNIVASWDGTVTIADGWTESNGIYYKTQVIPADNSETKPSYPILSSFTTGTEVSGATLKLDILLQSIPYVANKTCEEAFAAL